MASGQVERLFAALGNEVRLRIVELVSANKEMCICELVDVLDKSQANISRHVSVLRDAGVLSDRKVGAWVLLRVDEGALVAAFGGVLETVRRHHEQSRSVDAERRLTERCESI